jgi:mannose-1-phosphate guanylyltransferase / mannose-6-phosphate isomerase
MALYPVIMCGGAGTRLWPASRPSRPKQFIALAGNRSLFQDTVERVSDLASDGGRLVVIGGAAHGETIADQLAQVDVEAQVLLEPEARDSAAAMAAVACWVAALDPEGVLAFVASDHHIPDARAFRRAVRDASAAAEAGRIVTLGVRPSAPSSAYGYIKPAGLGLAPVESFHEKPDAEAAAGMIASGFLWNSGNFIVSAETLVSELQTFAPAVLSASAEAAPAATERPAVQLLGEGFRAAPKISIDYAVMERTRRASVLPVDFAWSDLGAWDSVADSGEGSTGIHILEDSERVLTRAPDGVLVAALGVKDVAIVVEPDAVLVCDLHRSQEIKKVVERMRSISPQHLDHRSKPPESLSEGAQSLADWLRLRALPVWSTLGLGADGGFKESLTLAGQAASEIRRARVQTRQIFVFARAKTLGWHGPADLILTTALQRLRTSYLREDGASRALLGADWSVLNDEAALYDQAFVLFALAAAREAGVGGDVEADAVRLRQHLLSAALPNGGFREVGDHPFQANAHMHLLEAAMAWSELSDDPEWSRMADAIADLALARFIDPDGGFLREFFDETWAPAAGDDGTLVEPGHQFEWAWLMARRARSANSDDAAEAARRLYAAGLRGVAHRPAVAVDAMADDFTLRSRRARLWPQTEWLKASLILAESAVDGERQAHLDDAATALRALKLYLTEDGLWRDKRLPSGGFIDEPAPASSFYHIMAAFDQLSRTTRALNLTGGRPLDLGHG